MTKSNTTGINDIPERSKVIADALCEEIIQGQLQAGEKLSEANLASKFNVSRGPIREALKRLAERDLVVFAPNAGAKVKHHSLEDMLDLLEVRLPLEVASAQLAAERMTRSEKLILRELFNHHKDVVLNKDNNRYVQSAANLDFHYMIVKGADNPVLFKILCEDLYAHLRICRRQHQNVSGRAIQALEEHRRILLAIEDSDVELVGILMRRHLITAKEGLRKVL